MPGIDVELLDHRDREVAERIHVIQVAAYEQEAHLLGAVNFPPLRRKIEDIERSADCFLGARLDSMVVGAIAIAGLEPAGELQISSLVVLPQFHRRGVGRALLGAVISRFGDQSLTVSTGTLNQPALKLYAKFGFFEFRQCPSGEEAILMVELCRPNGSSNQAK